MRVIHACDQFIISPFALSVKVSFCFLHDRNYELIFRFYNGTIQLVLLGDVRHEREFHIGVLLFSFYTDPSFMRILLPF